MAKKTKPSNISGVEEKLRSLYDLQIVDRRIDEIRNLRGELPLEVQDLEDEIAGMQTRFSKVEEEHFNITRIRFDYMFQATLKSPLPIIANYVK